MKRFAFLFILMLFQLSCERRTELSYDFRVDNLAYFPFEDIRITFHIEPEGGNPPFELVWAEPDSLKGNGPFTINIREDISLDFKITDAENTSRHFTHIILKDTIDSITYDYRNKIAGDYSCDVVFSNFLKDNYGNYMSDSLGNLIKIYKYWTDTIAIEKSEDFKLLNIPDYSTFLIYNYSDEDEIHFYGYHSGATFKTDSIFYVLNGPLGNYYTLDHKGVKCKDLLDH